MLEYAVHCKHEGKSTSNWISNWLATGQQLDNNWIATGTAWGGLLSPCRVINTLSNQLFFSYLGSNGMLGAVVEGQKGEKYHHGSTVTPSHTNKSHTPAPPISMLEGVFGMLYERTKR